jgi:nitrite reductase/ring-hydroxylating ferredoxin subunit
MAEAARNPAQPISGAYLCKLADIYEPGAKGFRFEADDSLWFGFVVRTEGQVMGYVDNCPHAGWLLSVINDRFLTRDGRHIICGGHGALFRPVDGLCVSGPCQGLSLEPWPIEVRDGEVFSA